MGSKLCDVLLRQRQKYSLTYQKRTYGASARPKRSPQGTGPSPYFCLACTPCSLLDPFLDTLIYSEYYSTTGAGSTMVNVLK